MPFSAKMRYIRVIEEATAEIITERMLACITLNGLSVLVFLLTDLLFGIPPSSDQFLNIARLFGTMA